MDLYFEDLRARAEHGGDAGPDPRVPENESVAALIADGLTVAEGADAALFDPLGTSQERSETAYRAALRVRERLKT
jgi:hypothetical protein